jgi:hypothetical protein
MGQMSAAAHTPQFDQLVATRAIPSSPHRPHRTEIKQIRPDVKRQPGPQLSNIRRGYGSICVTISPWPVDVFDR